jgi:hypothetical protein
MEVGKEPNGLEANPKGQVYNGFSRERESQCKSPIKLVVKTSRAIHLWGNNLFSRHGYMIKAP